MIRVLFTAIFILGSLAHAGPSYKGRNPIWTLTCESVLLPLSRTADEGSPALASLREIISYATELSEGLKKDEKYAPIPFTEINKKNASSIVHRWKWIERDLINVREGNFSVGYEIRGETKIREALSVVEQSHQELRRELDKTIKEQLPFYRFPNFADVASKAVTAGMVAAGAYSADYYLLSAGLFLNWFYYDLNKLTAKLNTDRGYRDFISAIKNHLNDVNFKSAILYGGNFSTSPDYTKELIRNLNIPDGHIDPSVRRRASVSKAQHIFDHWYGLHGMFRLDKNGLPVADEYDYKYDPAYTAIEGTHRINAIDQIFYRDPNTQELVWLVFFNSQKPNPRPQKPRKKIQEDATESQSSWLPGLLPQPVPVPVKNR